MQVKVKEARMKFSSLLTRVQQGEEIIITRYGKEIARLVPPQSEKKQLPSLKDFRASIQLDGEALSETIIKQREEERY